MAAAVEAEAGGADMQRRTFLQAVPLLLILVVTVLLPLGCGGSSGGPDADRDKTLQEVRDGASELSEDGLRETIGQYETAIEEEQDQDKARKLKDRLKVYTDELTRRDQK